MSLTSKSFGVLFIAWAIMLFFLAYCLYINAYSKIIIVTDGVLKNVIPFFPRSSFTLFFGLIICVLYVFYKIYTKNGKTIHLSLDTFWVVLLISCIALFFSFLQQINVYGLANSPIKLTTIKWTTKTVKEKIKSLPEYKGDSLIVYQDGTIESKNPLVQNTIMQMYVSYKHLQRISARASADKQPEAYYTYQEAMIFEAEKIKQQLELNKPKK